MSILSAKEIMNDIASKGNVLKEINEGDRAKLQQTLLGMLKDLKAACDEIGIRFALCGGSALGAYRHKGFIPWDDDIDIVMLRSDWEIFKVNFEKILGNKYLMEAPAYGEKDTKNTWGKVYLKNTTLQEIHDINTPFCHGIFIDVFIAEYVSSNKIVRYFDAFLSDFLKGVATSMVFYKYPNPMIKTFMSVNIKSRLFYGTRRFIGFCFSIFSHKAFCAWYDKFVSRHKNGKLVTIPTGRKNYLGELFNLNDVLPFKSISFCGENVYVYNNIEEYLNQLYGVNYMQLPPIEKREKHFVVDLKFS